MSQRLDLEIVARGLASSRTAAQRLIADGQARVDGRVARRASEQVEPNSTIEVPERQWVSRAAAKLVGALEDLPVRIGRRVLDAGASTGGFTQVLLSKGAECVYAIDVGHDQLHEQVRADPRVVVREGFHLRDLTLSDLDDQPVSLVVADVSFISLRHLVGALLPVIEPSGQALLMIKPQFEVGRGGLGAHGVVRDADQRQGAVEAVVAQCRTLGWDRVASAESRLVGRAGNIETFVLLEACQDAPLV